MTVIESSLINSVRATSIVYIKGYSESNEYIPVNFAPIVVNVNDMFKGKLNSAYYNGDIKYVYTDYEIESAGYANTIIEGYCVSKPAEVSLTRSEHEDLVGVFGSNLSIRTRDNRRRSTSTRGGRGGRGRARISRGGRGTSTPIEVEYLENEDSDHSAEITIVNASGSGTSERREEEKSAPSGCPETNRLDQSKKEVTMFDISNIPKAVTPMKKKGTGLASTLNSLIVSEDIMRPPSAGTCDGTQSDSSNLTWSESDVSGQENKKSSVCIPLETNIPKAKDVLGKIDEAMLVEYACHESDVSSFSKFAERALVLADPPESIKWKEKVIPTKDLAVESGFMLWKSPNDIIVGADCPVVAYARHVFSCTYNGVDTYAVCLATPR